jgi:L-arabinose isomerase
MVTRHRAARPIDPLKPLGQAEVWFVTGSQDLYGPDALRQVAANAERVATALNEAAAIPVRVVFRPVVASPEAIAATCLEANASDACVGIIAWMHTFSPARMWIAGLQALAKPLLHLHTQFNRDLPWGEIDMDYMNLHQAAHGDREFGYIETRLRVARKTVVGHWADPYVADRIGAWSRAAGAWREAHRLKVARFGDNMRHVADTEGDKVEAQIRLGVSINGYGVSDLGEAVRAVAEAEVDLLLDAYADAYQLAPELRPNGARRRELRDAARIEAALRGFLTAGGFGAFTDTFEDLDGLGQLPGIAAQRLMADGFGFGAEGDWKSAVLVRLLKVMATGLPGGTSFMEDYTYDLDPAGPKVLGAHMLEVCPSIAAGRPSCEIHPLSIGGRSDPVRLVFDAAPGPAIVVGLTDIGDRFRLVANVIDIVAADRPLPRLPVARAVWQPRPDMRTAVEAWLTAGGAHHTALSRALGPEPLVDFAEMAGIELLLIDETTTVPAFRRELRWNQAYHHLARGI